mgnify:CR=1 FL=1
MPHNTRNYTVRHRSPAVPARMRRHSPPVPKSANSNHSSPFNVIKSSSPIKVIDLSYPFKGERNNHPSPFKGEHNNHPSPSKGESNNYPSPFKGEVRSIPLHTTQGA